MRGFVFWRCCRVRLPSAFQFALPFAVIALCTGVNLVLQPFMDNRAPFLPFFVGIAVAALYGGRAAALLTLALSVPVVALLWMTPVQQLTVAAQADLVALAAYVVVASLLIAIALQARAGRLRSEHFAAELARSEWRLKQAVAMADLAVYEWMPATGELRWDARHKAMFGLAADAAVDIHMRDAAIHPEDRARMDVAKARCLDPQGDGLFDVEYRVLGYDGVLRWVAARGQTFFADGKPVHYLGVARETTGEHRAADELRRAAARARLLTAASEAVRDLADPREIAVAAMAVLREHLQADRCAYAEVEADENHFSFAGAAMAPGVPGVAGRYPVSAFGAECLATMRAGRPFVADDALLSLPPGAEREAYERTGIRALIALPLHKGGRLVAGTGVHMLQPRAWRADEIEAAQMVTERIWEAIERARIARDLTASEQRFRVAQEASPLAFVMFRAVRNAAGAVVDLQWTYANAAAGQLARHAPVDLVGRRLLEVFPASRDAGGFYDAFVRVLDTGETVSVEVPYRDAEIDGVFLHAVSKIDDGIAVWFMDITERRKAERALVDAAQSLERERERLEIALRAGGMGVYEWRVGAPQVWWSPELHAVYGTDPASFVPTVEAFSALVHPDDRALLWEKTEASLASGGVFTHEYRVLLPDGTLRWVTNRSQVGRNAQGEPERITGVAVDITERKRAEQLLREADRRKDEFLATLAHELRNPLAPIRNAAALLDLEGPAAGPARVAREVIKRQVAHMVRLVDDLLDVSRITQNRLTLRPEPVAVGVAVEQAVEAVRPLLDAAQQQLDVDLPERPLRLLADPVRLVQVLTNLLTNASKYSAPAQRITLRAHQADRKVVLQVEDQGIGIASDELPRVFEMFAQASPALDRAQGGLGIGLWLSRQLVELQGGTVSADSDGPGRGSRFTVTLPAAQGALVAPAPAGAEQRVDGVQRVLVVDDNIDAASTLAELLTVLGCTVDTAFDGPQALQRAEAFLPDVVLLDIGLPQMNGFEVCRRLRGRYGTALRIIAMTGWGQEEDRRRSREAGFDLHLVKPVDPAVLVDALNSAGGGPGVSGVRGFSRVSGTSDPPRTSMFGAGG
jgi:PAS domain S-box-containing protein